MSVFETFDQNLYKSGVAVYSGDGTALVSTSVIPQSSIGDGYSTGNYEVVQGALQSGDFLTKVQGWQINANGNVEFNNGVFRGALSASTIDIGVSTAFHVDINGNLWLGAATFAAAPFSVSSSGVVTISGAIGSHTFIAQPTTPYHIGDLWAGGSSGDLLVCIADRLTGAYNSADWALASMYLGSSGVTTIVGNTVTTGFVNALSVVAGSVSANNITAGIITGSTLQTASSGQRVVVSSSPQNRILFYDASTLYGYIEANKTGSVGYINLYAQDNVTGVQIYTGIGASANASVVINANGGSFETSGNSGSNSFIGLNGPTGTIGIEIVAAGPETAFVDYVPFEVRYKLQIPVGTNLY